MCRVIEIHHLNKVKAGRSVNLCEEIVVRHFRNVLKMRQKQVSIERFLVKMEKRPSSNLQAGARTKNTQRKTHKTLMKDKLVSHNQALVECRSSEKETGMKRQC